MTNASCTARPFTIAEALKVLGLSADEAEDFNDIDFLYVYRAGCGASVSTKTLQWHCEDTDAVRWDA